MSSIRQQADTLIFCHQNETVIIQPWGPDGLRLRATQNASFRDLPHALLTPVAVKPEIAVSSQGGYLRNGKARVEIDADGRLCFRHGVTGKALLLEEAPIFHRPPSRQYRARGGDNYQITVRFQAQPGERFYGLGQHTSGLLDQKGCVVELAQRNTQVSIPFLVSSLGYGFLWNNPAIGRVELGRDVTRWIAESSPQIDYYFTVGDSYAEIMEHYADATGHPPLLPEFAAGFWQCKLRYRTQAELLSVAREYRRRGLPLSVIVIDFFHWTMMGDWQFDPECWHDPTAMTRELEEMGIKLMVSVWPTLNASSKNFTRFRDNGWLVRTERGVPAHLLISDSRPGGPVYVHYYDATNPEARQAVWEQVRENYYRHGIKVWWLDACEPEIYPADFDNLRYHLGSGLEVGNIYPLMHARGFYEGMLAAGEKDVITLCRSAWAGSQRYGAAVWSGDIPSTFESLQTQVRAGLNIAMSGIPWWTTDIGGFLGGDISSSYFRELIVRWFQYGVFCPLFRLHGVRQDSSSDMGQGTGSGAANEVWSFGEPAYQIIKKLLQNRERLRPYIMQQMQLAHEKGIPPMRPLFFDYADDPETYQVEDQFLFGADILVAPVLFQGQVERQVYLPAGTDWQDAHSGERLKGGQWLNASAPLERIPVYYRWGSKPLG